jgi:Zn-dependent peptidase ImmA (M78 family)/transcriptional regulator with XRE-family HTH domain
MPTAEHRPRALVTPQVLTWARREAGFDPEIAARKLAVKPDRLARWESGEERPTIPQLLKLSEIYKRNPAVFYLPEPPREAIAVHDFRRLPEAGAAALSSGLRYEIRLAGARRETLLGILGADAPETRLPAAGIGAGDAEAAAAEIRVHLGITMPEQKTWRRPDTGFRFWREALERIGVLVFQTTRVEVKEMRGFSLLEDRLPVVLLNGGDAPAGRTFSLLHELCHLILREGGLCLPGQDRPVEDGDHEVLCNRIAGATLVPADSLLAEPLVRRAATRREWADEDLAALAREYAVSREAVLRRLLIVGRTTERFYREKRRQFAAATARQVEDQGGFVPPFRQALNRMGRVYAKGVLESFYEGRVSASDLSRYLGLKLRHLADFEAAVFS